MAAHSSILAWRIPLTEEPGSQRIRHNLATKQQLFLENSLKFLKQACKSILYSDFSLTRFSSLFLLHT